MIRPNSVHVPSLRARCAELACFPLDPRRQKLRALARLRPGRPLTLDYFDNAPLRQWVRATVERERIGRVFVFCSAMAPYVMDLHGTRRVLDLIDVDSSKWTEYAGRSPLPMRWIWAREGRTLLTFEREAVQRFDRALFVSEHECNHFQALAPETLEKTGFICNGVDAEIFSPGLDVADPFQEHGQAIVFTGAMDYRPNIDAVAWFAREVLPKVRAGRPDAHFWIVGANPSDEVRRLARVEGVHVTGRVPDTRPYLAHADVVVAPLRIARGIQNKVLEAMAMARPVVASPQAFEGVRAEPGHDLLLADTAQAMADRVADVLDGLHPTLGPNARCAMLAHHDWNATLAPLERLWEPRPDTAAMTKPSAHAEVAS